MNSLVAQPSESQADKDVKEVYMNLALSGGGDSEAKTRKSSGARRPRKRRTMKAVDQEGGYAGEDVVVTKTVDPAPASQELAPVSQSLVILGSPNPAVPQIFSPASGGASVVAQLGGGAAKAVLAPPKKKLAKVLFVPKAKGLIRNKDLKKTFKAKRFRVVIDNTAKTLKARKQTLGRVDSMSDEQVRAATVAAKLIGAERAKKAPIALQRQMLKDYQTMRGAML